MLCSLLACGLALERDVVEHVHAHVAKTGCTVCASRAEDASWCPDSNNMQIFDEPIQVSKRIKYHQLRGALQPRRMRARSRHGRHSASGRAPKSCDAQTRGGRETERSTAHSGGCQKVRRDLHGRQTCRMTKQMYTTTRVPV